MSDNIPSFTKVRSLRHALLIQISLVATVVVAVAVSATAVITLSRIQQRVTDKSLERLSGYHDMIAYMVEDVDYLGAKRIGLLLEQDSEIDAFRVVNRFGRVIVSAGDFSKSSKGWMPVFLDIANSKGTILANATYLVRAPAMGRDVYLRVALISLCAGALFALFALTIFLFLSNRLLGPIRALHQEVMSASDRGTLANPTDGAPVEVVEMSSAIGRAFKEAQTAARLNRQHVATLTTILEDFRIAIRHYAGNDLVFEYGWIDSALLPPFQMVPGKSPIDQLSRAMQSAGQAGYSVQEINIEEYSTSHALKQYECTRNDAVFELTLIELGHEACAIAVEDVSRARELEKAVQQTQKLEVVGQFASGIAHDFNNILGIVVGNAEILKLKKIDRELAGYIDPIISASERGSLLTRSLLSFTRQSKLDTQVIDLNKAVNTLTSWSARVLPENIDFNVVLQSGIWPVSADASMAESAVLNLMINARDAMPDGGKLTIETANVTVDEDYAKSRLAPIRPGRYGMLAVSDTGSGIPKEQLEHIFEPFFTTKAKGKGTGLGLSMVYGFMRQSGGLVRVYSEVGIGTTFKLFFPAASSDEGIAKSPKTHLQPLTTNVHLLVVEDDPDLRTILVQRLQAHGYRVSAADNGDEALALYQAVAPVDIVLTDIVMPGSLSGPDLMQALRRLKPNLPSIFMSGYPQEASVHGGGLLPEDIRLMKPVRHTELIKAIEKLMMSAKKTTK